MKKITLVLGASENTERYSNLAVRRLKHYQHPVIAIGKIPGNIDGTVIETSNVEIKDLDTVTLYLNAGHQKKYYDYILSLHPKRIIFNPGAENEELYEMAIANGIKPLEACTLVMLNTGQY